MSLNVEIKARHHDIDFVRKQLLQQSAEFIGVDFQTDTYFNVVSGRLKLREGNIENNLIYYKRENSSGPKNSDFTLVKLEDAESLKRILSETNGIKVIVKKKREIFYIGNVKFHIDEVEGLGNFIEIEAGNIFADLPREKLLEQCRYYVDVFGVKEEWMIDCSYSDMLLPEM